MSDLVERLRGMDLPTGFNRKILQDAANAIVAKDAEIERLNGLLTSYRHAIGELEWQRQTVSTQGWPRTESFRRENSRFEPHGLTEESKYIVWELERLGARHGVVSTNIELRRDGLPYSNRRQPEDPGVAVYFQQDGKQQCIPCDRWRTVEENCRAIWKPESLTTRPKGKATFSACNGRNTMGKE